MSKKAVKQKQQNFMSNSKQDFLQPDGPETIETPISNVLKAHFSIDQKDLEKIKNKFKVFIEEPVNDLWKNVDSKSQNLVVRVFTYNPYEEREEKKKANIYTGTSDKTVGDLRTLNFPIGKVLRAGSECFWIDGEGKENRYKVGDIVKLRDANARIIPNPKYEAWSQSGAGRTSGKQVGKEPDAYMNELIANYWKNMTLANPIDLNVSFEDHYTFDLHMNHLEGKVKNPELYIK